MTNLDKQQQKSPEGWREVRLGDIANQQVLQTLKTTTTSSPPDVMSALRKVQKTKAYLKQT